MFYTVGYEVRGSVLAGGNALKDTILVINPKYFLLTVDKMLKNFVK